MSLFIFGVISGILTFIGCWIDDKFTYDFELPAVAFTWIGILGLGATLIAWFTLILQGLGLIKL